MIAADPDTSDALAVTAPASQPERGAAADGAAGLLPGTIVGRYVILHRIGVGGMGEVFAAHDPDLDRRVAVKVLRGTGGHSPDASRGRARLLREALALAKLAHPNVVAVHDVGLHEGAVYLAMEHVDGATLRSWVDVERQPWKRVLEVVLAVGEGVAAAHDANLLHRDIKPENVMLGRDGRVRLMDFGLARTALQTETLDADDAPAAGDGAADALAAQVTGTGVVAGTPKYMAPEQWRGGPIGPAVDQFALCVMAWELLGGERPFSDDGAFARRHVAAASSAPRWLRGVLDVGLAVDCERRYPSVRALLTALRRGEQRQRWRRWGQLAVAASGVTLAFFGYRQHAFGQSLAACERTGDEIFSAWNPERRGALETAVIGTGVSYAADTTEKVLPLLDAYAAQWRGARASACVATEVREEWNDDTAQRALWCIEERKEYLASLVDEFTARPREALEAMVAAAAGLPWLDSCLDPDRLASTPLPPDGDRPAVASVRASVIRASNMAAAGNYAAASALAESALIQARAVSWAPLTSAALRQVGATREHSGDYAGAETAYEDAYFEAAHASVAPESAADAATALVFMLGARLARPADARRWARMADSVLAGLPSERLRRAKLWSSRGALHRAAGEYAEALKNYDLALQTWIEVLGPDHPYIALGLSSLGTTHADLGDRVKATDFHERALTIREASLGGIHPMVGHSRHNLAVTRYELGDYAQARQFAQQALEIREASFGPEHPFVAETLGVLAAGQAASGDLRGAKATLARALSINEKTLGPTHPDVAADLANLAMFHRESGEFPEAAALSQRALIIEEATLGADHPAVALTLHGLGAVRMEVEDFSAAEAAFRRSVAILENTLGMENLDLVEPLTALAECLLAQGANADALRQAERAVALSDAAGGRADSRAAARFVLARAMWTTAGDGDVRRVRARTLAEQALEEMRRPGANARPLAQLEAWLAAHPPETE